MAGLVPAIHALFAQRKEAVDARVKPGHDEFVLASRFQNATSRFQNATSHSRGTLRPSFASNFCSLSKSEGAGNAGCALHPRSHAQCAQKVRA
jgi:hypothetical protein